MLQSLLFLLLRWFGHGAPALLLAAAGTFAAAQSRPAMFEVSSTTGKVYVLGSMHVGRKDFYPLPAAVEEAWKGSKALAVEADASDPAAVMALAPLMLCKPPDSLAKHLTPEGWKQVEAQLGQPKVKEALQRIGLPEAAVKLFRPWALTTTLAVAPLLQDGFDAASGIDLHFLQRAKSEPRPILQIESLAFQMELLSSMPQDVQETMLLETLNGIASGKASQDVGPMVEAWAKGDLDQLLRLSQKATSTPQAKAWMRSLLEGRNPGMAEKIAGYLAGPDPVFVVIGAAHLGGPEGVIELLRRQGFKVKRME